jgi:ankyrin repeat protein
MVELLLDRGAPFDARNPQGGTALRSAADTGHIDVVRVLLARSAQPNVVDTFGKTPRHYATEHGHREIVEILDKLR